MTQKKTHSVEHEQLYEMEWKRGRGYEMLCQGMKKSVISMKLGVNRKIVYNWFKRIENDCDYRSRKKTGRKSHLSGEQKETLKKIIDSGALVYGYPTYIWQLLDVLGYSSQMPLLST